MLRGERQRCRFTLRGVEVGIGVRPFVRRIAESLRLAGFCERQDHDVVIEVEGERRSVLTFRRLLMSEGPSTKVREWMVRPLDLTRERGFSIANRHLPLPQLSDLNHALRPCLRCPAGPLDRHEAEGLDPVFERGLRICHRSGTSVRAERSCPLTGASVWLESAHHSVLARGPDCLLEAVDLLLAGGTISVKGPHGYHLVADATDRRAIERLRTWKAREREPFAVLFGDLAAAREYVSLSAEESETLLRAEAPIVLVRLQDDFAAQVLGGNVAPGRGRLGVVLASTPFLHALASGVGRPLVMTRAVDPSGHVIETDEQARGATTFVDAHLLHDGPAGDGRDTSVLQHASRHEMTLFRARGLAERAFPLETGTEVVLGLGSTCDFAIALAARARAWLLPAMATAANESLETLVQRMARRYVGREHDMPTLITHDIDGSCAIAAHAVALAERWNARVRPVHHPDAHMAAGCVEFGIQEPIHALLLDDGGLGRDGMVWGGEVLYGTPGHVERLASLRPFQIPQREPCRRDPRVSAVAVLHALGSDRTEALACDGLGRSGGMALLDRLEAKRFVETTTSVGVLFEAVAALLLDARRAAYGLEPLWAMHDAWERSEREHPAPAGTMAGVEVDWRPLIAQLVADRERGMDAGDLVARFHRELVEAFVSRVPGTGPVLLCGSVLQSPAVVSLVCDLFGDRELLVPRTVSPGDQGVALGQVAVALATTGSLAGR